MARIETLDGGRYREEDLDGALDSNAEEAKDDESDKEDEVDITKIDFQLARAIDLLQGLSVFGTLNTN